jgi:predicted Zn-dependent peptidase
VIVDRSCLPGVGPDLPFRLPRPEKRRLDCGLRVWTVRSGRLPVVAAMLVLPVGSASDPEALPGLAALTADLLDEGAGDRDGLALHDALARIGAHFDTECVSDATLLGVLSLVPHAGTALALLADIAFRPRFAPEDFDRLRTQRRRRLQQMRDVPSALADRVFVEALFRGHPYGHLPIGTEEALEAVDLEDVRAFHQRSYRPESATLLLVGDLDHDRAFELAGRTFGGRGLGEATVAGTAVLTAPPNLGREAVIVHRPNAQQSELRIGRIGAARSTSDYHALVVANAVLGGQFASRINLNLREDKGYTYGARSYFDFRRAEGPFVVQASVQTDATVLSVREVLSELDGLRGTQPVTPRELDLARHGLTRGFARNFETPEQIARAMTQLVLYGLPDDTFDTFVGRVRAVDAATVTDVAQRHFAPESMFTVIVGDRDRIEPGIEVLGFSRCTVVEPRPA